MLGLKTRAPASQASAFFLPEFLQVSLWRIMEIPAEFSGAVFYAYQRAAGFDVDTALFRGYSLVYQHSLSSFYVPGCVLSTKDEESQCLLSKTQFTTGCDYCFSLVGLHICLFIQQTLLSTYFVSGMAINAGTKH